MDISEKDQTRILRVGHRARIWALFQMNPDKFFTIEEIAEKTGLKPATIQHGLKFVRMLPRVQTQIDYENGVKTSRYGIKSII